jgi:hypothetical protein
MLVWTRITNGEHQHAAQPICDDLPYEEQNTCRHAAFKIQSQLRGGWASNRMLRLKAVLDSYADGLADRIDRGTDATLGSWPAAE